MMDIKSIQKQYEKACNINEIWNLLHKLLIPYGITSIFYGFGHSDKLVEVNGIIDSIWYKTSHPEEYCLYYANKYYIDDDLSSIHCRTKTSPFLWHDFSAWGTPTTRQKRFMHESWDFDMGVGVSLPFHFKNDWGQGVGGFGLAASHMTPEEFNTMWNNHSKTVQSITDNFNDYTVFKNCNIFFQLSPRELEVLSYLAKGFAPSEISAKIGNSSSTVGHQIRNARKKLQATSDEQAIAKCIVFGIITT